MVVISAVGEGVGVIVPVGVADGVAVVVVTDDVALGVGVAVAALLLAEIPRTLIAFNTGWPTPGRNSTVNSPSATVT